MSRVSGHNICRIALSNDFMRSATDGLGLNVPTELFNKNGDVDHKLTSEAGSRIASPAGGHLELVGFAGIGIVISDLAHRGQILVGL